MLACRSSGSAPRQVERSSIVKNSASATRNAACSPIMSPRRAAIARSSARSQLRTPRIRLNQARPTHRSPIVPGPPYVPITGPSGTSSSIAASGRRLRTALASASACSGRLRVRDGDAQGHVVRRVALELVDERAQHARGAPDARDRHDLSVDEAEDRAYAEQSADERLRPPDAPAALQVVEGLDAEQAVGRTREPLAVRDDLLDRRPLREQRLDAERAERGPGRGRASVDHGHRSAMRLGGQPCRLHRGRELPRDVHRDDVASTARRAAPGSSRRTPAAQAPTCAAARSRARGGCRRRRRRGRRGRAGPARRRSARSTAPSAGWRTGRRSRGGRRSSRSRPPCRAR